jgi:U2-associated protein SR140
MLRTLTPQKSKVGEVMVFCMEHSEAAEEICECIAESLGILTTALHKKVIWWTELKQKKAAV